MTMVMPDGGDDFGDGNDDVNDFIDCNDGYNDHGDDGDYEPLVKVMTMVMGMITMMMVVGMTLVYGGDYL